MSITDKLQQLDIIKADIKTAINNKGGNVGDDFTTYATAIENIEGGTGGEGYFEITNDTSLAFSQFKEVPSNIRLGSSTTKAKNLFRNCEKLTTLPDWDFSNINNAYYMCSSCKALEGAVYLNMPNVTDCANIFYNTPYLTSIELPNTSKCKTFSNAFNDYTKGDAILEHLGEIDCTSVTTAGTSNMVYYQTNLVDVGGFKNLGMGFEKLSAKYTFNLTYSTKLSAESLENIIKGLADVNDISNGYTCTMNIANTLVSLIPEDIIAIATRKGWTVA